MDLQTTFYTIGIIYMVLMMIITIGFVLYMVILVRRFEEFQRSVEQKVNNLITPTTVLGIGSVIFRGLSGLFKRRR